MVRVAGSLVQALEAEQVDVELRHLVGVQGAKSARWLMARACSRGGST